MIEILSLFDGMSCGQITLNELDIPIDKYYSSEIDKFAICQTQLNFKDTIQLGTIENWREWKIDWSKIGLVLAGSPCQGFSFAGEQLNFEDERSKLFFVFVDILNHIKKFNPDVKFLLENVIMKKEYQRVINDILGLYPARINSNLVSAQNRDRLYWTNINIKMVGLFNEIHTDISQPKDRKILLKDILQPESEIDEKYYIKNPEFISYWNFDQTKPTNITKKKHRALLANCGGKTKGVGIYGIDIDGKAPTQRNSTGRCLDKKHNYQIIQINPSKESGGNQPYQQNRIYDINGQMPALNAELGGRNNITDGIKLRRLTPTECARLQTVPSWYKWNCSDTQQYKMLGNGWTIEVIKHILKHL